MAMITDPQTDQVDQAVSHFHMLLPLKCMATGRIKSKIGKGFSPRRHTMLPEHQQPSPRWFTVTSLRKAGKRKRARWFLLNVVPAPEPCNHSGQSQKLWEGSAALNCPGGSLIVSRALKAAKEKNNAVTLRCCTARDGR